MATFVIGHVYGRTERVESFESVQVRAKEIGLIPHRIEPVPGMAGWFVLRGPSTRDPVIYSDDRSQLEIISQTHEHAG